MNADPITVDQGAAGTHPGHAWPYVCAEPCTACDRDDAHRRAFDLNNLAGPIALGPFLSPPSVDELPF